MRRNLRILALLAVLAGTGAIAWRAAGLPPVRYLLRYGLSPGCEPTGETLTIEGVTFVEIGPGISRMGSEHEAKPGDLLGRLSDPLGVPWGAPAETSDEMPVHSVEFRRGFLIARTEITNAQYARFDPEHERSEYSRGDDDPVVEVSWEDARRYCAWLSARSGREVRLPSESEWEAACRAGSESEYAFGDDETDLPEYAWFAGNSEYRAHAVGTRKPNAWGLHDLHGNVWEWCEDAWHESYLLTRRVTGRGGTPRTEVLARAPADGSAWPEAGGSPIRVRRGGSWLDSARLCRSASRIGNVPSDRWYGLGFRPAISVPSDP